MALSSACALIGRHVFYKNVMKTLDNSKRAVLSLSSNYSTAAIANETDAEEIFGNTDLQPTKKMSKAMKAYLQRAKEYDEFMEKEKKEYQIGKRHLANMMGEDPDRFTQDDVNKAIEYLFPSGLYERKARPIMAEPETIFPQKKAAQFDETGKPFHSMFYTIKPNFYEMLYNMAEELEKLNKIEDEQLNKGLLANEADKVKFEMSDWMKQNQLQDTFLETIGEKDYTAFITAMERLANHPYSANAKDFMMKYRVLRKSQTEGLLIAPLEYDEQGRPFIIVKNCKKKDARADVKVLGNGSGKITINGKDITYFLRLQHREQVSYFYC